MSAGRAQVLSVVTLLGGCSREEPSVRVLTPVLAVSPPRLDFGEVGPPGDATEVVVVTNSGQADLDVSAALTESPAFALVGDFSAAVVPPGESLELPITFTPQTFRTYEASLLLETNDGGNKGSVRRIPLAGKGVDLPLPDLEIAPSRTVTLDQLAPGETGQFAIELHNVGDAALSLQGFALDGPATFSEAFFPLVPGVIPAGQSNVVFVDYAPDDEEGEEAYLHVLSDDPLEPDLVVALVGNGGQDFEFPVALFDCPTAVDLVGPVTVVLDGSASYDPGGFEPLAYQWSVLARPAASDPDFVLDPDDRPTAELRVDVAGTWTVALGVTNALGAPAVPAVCTFEAVPADDVHVELTWADPTGDVDLHLNQAGNTLFHVPGDANWCNKNPDWGAGTSDDDPRLDIDDQGGFGPENINVFAPQGGAYDVVVHYYGPDADAAVTIATVRVWLAGALVFEGSQALAFDELWTAGRIEWPAATFTPSADPVVDAARRSCADP